MDRIIVFPYSLSSWRLQIMLEELGLSCNVEKVDMFQWEHLQPSHLRLSPSVRSLLRYSHLTAPPLSRRPSQSWSLRRAGRSLVRTFFIFSSPPHHHRRLPSPLMSASSVRSSRRSILGFWPTAWLFTPSTPSSWDFRIVRRNSLKRWLEPLPRAVAESWNCIFLSHFSPAIIFWPGRRGWMTPRSWSDLKILTLLHNWGARITNGNPFLQVQHSVLQGYF